MNVADLLESIRDLDDAVAQLASVGATADQFQRTSFGFFIWVPLDAETWERAVAAYEAECKQRELPRDSPRQEQRVVGTVKIGDF